MKKIRPSVRFGSLLSLGVLALLAASGPRLAAQGQPVGGGGGIETSRGVGPGHPGAGSFHISFASKGGLLPLLMMPTVQQELKLTDDQITALRNLMGMSGPRTFRSDDDPATAEAQMQKQDEEMDKSATAMLNSTQQARAKQLLWQRDGAHALSRSEVANLLGLSKEQRAQISQILDAEKSQMQTINSAPPQSPGEMETRMTQNDSIRSTADEQLLAVLTDAQRTKWKSLLGTPFNFPKENMMMEHGFVVHP